MKIINPNVSVPHGGMWKFRHRMLDIPVEAPDLNQLYSLATEIHKSNNLPLGLDIRRLWTQWLCEDMPDECLDDGNHAIRIGLADAVRGAKVIVKQLKEGNLVSSEEAERRAEICVRCIHNVAISVGPLVGCCGRRTGDILRSVLQTPKTSHHAKLMACRICHCFLSVAVYVPMDVQCPEVTPVMRQRFAKVPGCWKQCG